MYWIDGQIAFHRSKVVHSAIKHMFGTEVYQLKHQYALLAIACKGIMNCVYSPLKNWHDFVCLTLQNVLGYYQLSIGKLGKRSFKDCWGSWSWRWICSNGLCHLRDRCCHGSKSSRWRGPICQGDVPEGKEILSLCSQVFYLLLLCQFDLSSFSASRSINSWTCVLPLCSLFHLLVHVHWYSVILFFFVW